MVTAAFRGCQIKSGCRYSASLDFSYLVNVVPSFPKLVSLSKYSRRVRQTSGAQGREVMI